MDDLKAGLTTASRLNPEPWWDLVGIEHPVGNLNQFLLQATSLLPITNTAKSIRSTEVLEVPDIGTLSLKTSNLELISLYQSFVFLFNNLKAAAELEWSQWGRFVQGGGDPATLAAWIEAEASAIPVIGRAEKRLVVACSRHLLAHPDYIQACSSVTMKQEVKDALSQLTNLKL
eukprot:m.182568 g.182568  ORF g.182568 m.182568 type:complete len:174 (-) comp32122_c0_seq1:379-900(-)